MSVDKLSPPPPLLLRPYTPDPDTREARRRQRIITISLAAFCLAYGSFFAFIAPFAMMMFALPPVAVAVLVIWALPELSNPPTRTLENLFFAVFLSLTLWPSYLAIALPGIPWITVVRLAAFPMALIFVICLSISPPFRSHMATIMSGSRVVTALVLLFTINEVVSVAFSNEKGQTISKILIAQVMFTGVFLVGLFVFEKPGRATRFASMMWAVAIFICMISLVEFKLKHVPWVGHVPKILQIEDPSVQLALSGKVRAGVGVYRVQGVFSHPNTLAEFLALVIPFVINFAVQPYRTWVRLAAVASIPLMALIVHFTNSRIGSIGFLIAVLFYGFFWAYEQKRKGGGSLLGSAVLYLYPIGAACGLAATLFVGRLRRVVWGGGETQVSTEGRVQQLHMGIPLIEHNPLGYGMGRAGETLNFHAPDGFLTIDSFYLGTLLEFGVIGFLMYFASWGFAVYQAGRMVLRIGREDNELSLLLPAMIALINFLVIKSVFSQQDNHPIAYMLLGMVVALLFRAKAIEAAPAAVTTSPRSRFRRVLSAA